MKSQITNTSTTIARRFQRSLVGVAALLLVVVLGFGLAGVPSLRGPSRAVAPASSLEMYTPLDQHERHPAGLPNSAAPLDQHERHPAGTPARVPTDRNRRRGQDGGLLGELFTAPARPTVR